MNRVFGFLGAFYSFRSYSWAVSLRYPACCIAYQGKFNGLLSDYLHAPELLIDVEAAAKEGSFVSQLEERMGDLPRLAAAVATEIPRLRALAEKNFEA